VQTGVHIAIPNIVDFCAQFVTGATEYWLVKRGVATIGMSPTATLEKH
jgi:hypothetical protein